MKLVNWNLEWANPGYPRGRELKRRLLAQAPDVAVLTETVADFLAKGPEAGDREVTGHTICSEPRPMFKGAPRRRKVVVWSRSPWREVDTDGRGTLTDGRFARGITDTPLGPIEVWGVCIPWRDSHVRTGTCDKRIWEDHLDYLRDLGRLLREEPKALPRIVAGDFNQRIPRRRSPRYAYEALIEAFEPLNIATIGGLGPDARQTIDHVAHSSDLAASPVTVLSEMDGDRSLSDHFGVAVELSVRRRRSHRCREARGGATLTPDPTRGRVSA